MIYQQLWSFLPLCKILCHYVCYLYSKSLMYGKKQLCFWSKGFIINGRGLRVPPGGSNNFSSFKIINLLYFTGIVVWHFLRHYNFLTESGLLYFTLISILLLHSDINYNYNQIKCTPYIPSCTWNVFTNPNQFCFDNIHCIFWPFMHGVQLIQLH